MFNFSIQSSVSFLSWLYNFVQFIWKRVKRPELPAETKMIMGTDPRKNKGSTNVLWKVPPVARQTTGAVLVTGSSGCLGQHVVKLLQEYDNDCQYIFLFDLVPYVNNLNHSTKKPMKEICGSLTNLQTVREACKGVDCVIHCGALIDISLFPNEKALEEVNVKGTRNIIESCIHESVPYLVFASTTDTVVSSNHIIYGTENTTFVPKNFLMGPYAKSKHHAEQLVLQANNLPLADGSAKLLTCVLRPTTFYGEQDKHFITRIMTIAKLYGNSKIQKVRSTDERLQTTYVGNIAYAHVIAKNALQKNADCAGEIYYITDDTPLEDLYTSIKPYVEAQGSIRVSDSIIPYLLVILIMNISAFVLRLIRPIYQVGEYFPTPAAVRYACTTVFFNRQKAVLRLKYCPYYTHEMSHKNSLGYYKHVKV